MQTISKHSYSFSAGMVLGPTMPKYEGGHRQIDWEKLKEYIETNKSEIEKVDVGLAEDWDCTSGTIFENDGYCKSGSVYGQSDWATPAFEVTHIDGSVQMYECWKLGDDAYGYFELDLPKAIETTEILNEVKADKGILTEEELKKTEWLNQTDVLTYQEIEKVINSHRHLLSANAELSFKNMRLEQDVMKFKGIAQLFIDGTDLEKIHEIVEMRRAKEDSNDNSTNSNRS